MSVRDQLKALSSQPIDADVDWQSIRNEIHDEFKQSNSSEERVFLLEAHKILNDLLEQSLNDPEIIKTFQELRLKDYHFLLVQECLIGANVSPAALDIVTQREVASGRMTEDDELLAIAKIGSTFKIPEPTDTDMQTMSVLQRFIAWVRRH